jgi:citrate lyase beta subunit
MNTTLVSDAALAGLAARLSVANAGIAKRYPGEPSARQPVHTVYGGAQLFKHDTGRKLGAQALRSLEEYAPDASTLAAALSLAGGEDAHRTLYGRVVDKLRREPVEDFRIDFEDGYGNRSDAEEDAHAAAAAGELALGMELGTLPPFIGLRIKTLSDERLAQRGLRTLDLVVTMLVRETRGRLPANFVVCLAKIKHVEHVAVLADALALLEKRLSLPANALKLEIMIETTQSIFDERGNAQLPRLLEAANGRCVAAHFGTYDYTAACNITAAHQSMTHPACGFALQMMQVAYAGTGICLSDGSTTVLPVAPHPQPKDGTPLGDEQVAENRACVQRAWKLHFDDVQHSLRLGLFQGWDLHPAQLVTRYAALYDFFLRGTGPAGERLRNFVAKAGQATLVGDVFDDAATGQGLLNFFLRALNSGALTEADALAASSLTRDELRSRSFVKILAGRRR